MTAVTTIPAEAAAEPRARFRDLLAAEWLKYRTLRSTPWSLLVSALAVIAFNAGAAYEHDHYWAMNRLTPAEFIAQGLPLLDAYTTNAGIVMMVAAGAIGAIAVTGEFSSGLIRTTFAAVPARRSVMAAKVSVIVAVTTVFGAVVAAASFGLTQAMLTSHHAGVPISYPGALRVVTASALLAPLSALIGAATGVVVRRSAAGVAGSIVLLQVLPLLIRDGSHATAILAHALPFEAWNRLVAVPYATDGIAFPWSVAGAWVVFAVWAVGAAVAAVATLPRRDL